MARSPVLLLVFNRPDFALQSAEQILRSEPSRVYITADGPRRPAESSVTDETRQVVLDTFDGRVPITTRFRDSNLGCRRGVEDGISWFFELEPEGIVLEDDCLPSPPFFDFCDAMLDRFRDEARVMHVSGYADRLHVEGGYRFSQFPAVWGWATWARAWKRNPLELPVMITERRRQLRSAFATREEHRYFIEKWDQVQRGELDTWDFSWCYTLFRERGLAVQPLQNLVRNIGTGDPHAAHTTRRMTTSDVEHISLGELLQQRTMEQLPDYEGDRRFFRSRMAGRARLIRDLRRRLSWPGN